MKTSQHIRIAIVEDMKDVREGMGYYLNMEPTFQVRGSFESAETFLESLESGRRVDVVLMDIQLPGMTGIEAVPLVKERSPDTAVLMLTIFEDQEKILQSIRAGAGGYILKNTKPQNLIEQIKSLHDGGSPISPTIARTILTEIQRESPPNVTKNYGLTPREHQILEDIIDGLTYKDIAERYDIAASTAKKHILHIYQKLNVSSKVEIVKKVIPGRPALIQSFLCFSHFPPLYTIWCTRPFCLI